MSCFEPDRDCPYCSRLVEYRRTNQLTYPQGWNAPIPVWGDINAELLIVGLAPGVKGANLTGRPFTGDYAGTLLYNTLVKYSFASGEYQATPSDNLKLINTCVVNAVRCVPPQNKPTPQEEKNCRPFLQRTVQSMSSLKIILALGVIAHKNVLASFSLSVSKIKFRHGQFYQLPNDKIILANSYHVSRYNTSTKLLTTEMFEDVILKIQQTLYHHSK